MDPRASLPTQIRRRTAAERAAYTAVMVPGELTIQERVCGSLSYEAFMAEAPADTFH